MSGRPLRRNCDQIGFGSPDLTANETGSETVASVPGEGFKNTDTSAMTCPAGSTDADVVAVPTGENLPKSIPQHTIRLCKIPEIKTGINVAITENVIKMIAAAKADGVALTGSSFRTTAGQIEARKRNGCPDIYTAPPSSCRTPTARPGQSMHEQALAIDFENCKTRSTRCHIWLGGNAARFGFKNLKSEPWHWFTTGN